MNHSSYVVKTWASLGNLGLLDQSAALEWVRANVASFGGDAGAVTVGGHGFGGGSAVADMLASTAFEGLFSKVSLHFRVSQWCNFHYFF